MWTNGSELTIANCFLMNRIIIAHLLRPSSAATNRILAYASGFVANKVEVSLVFGIHPDYDTSSLIIDEKLTTYYVRAPHGYHLIRTMAKRIEELYDENTTAILVYGSPALCWFLPKRHFNIFYECTEVPFYGRKKTISAFFKEIIKGILIHRATGMLVISKALELYFRNKGISRIAIINMFVDSKRFEGINSTTNEKYVAYCGTISPFKDGVDCLIQAFWLFSTSHPEYKLKIIGQFESREAEHLLKQLVADLKLEDRIVFAGMISKEEMPIILSGAAILALARPDNEQAHYGFPTKVGEYLATGKPVVVTDVGEIGEFLKDGLNCRMVKPGNPRAFAACMEWIVDNYDDALKLAAKGKELTRNDFSSIVQSKRALSFMESCIE